MRIQIIYLCVFISIVVKAQNVQVNPYEECLKFHLESLKERNNLKDTVYLQPNNYFNLTSGFFEGTYIKVVDERLIREKTKKGKMIGIVFVNPVTFDGDIQSISVTHFSVTRKKKQYNFVNSGGTKVILHYDCETGAFKYEVTDSH